MRMLSGIASSRLCIAIVEFAIWRILTCIGAVHVKLPRVRLTELAVSVLYEKCTVLCKLTLVRSRTAEISPVIFSPDMKSLVAYSQRVSLTNTVGWGGSRLIHLRDYVDIDFERGNPRWYIVSHLTACTFAETANTGIQDNFLTKLMQIQPSTRTRGRFGRDREIINNTYKSSFERADGYGIYEWLRRDCFKNRTIWCGTSRICVSPLAKGDADE